MKDTAAKKHLQIHDPQIWLQEHGNYLFRYALARLHDKSIAEDMVQETLLSAFRGREGFKSRSSVRAWLVGILKHKLLDHFRKCDRETPFSGFVSGQDPSEALFDEKGKWKIEPASWAENPRTVLERKEFWETFIRCMTELPQRLARVFSLRELEGLKSEELCNLLGVSATNLGVILYRARMRLRRCLEMNWLERGPERG